MPTLPTGVNQTIWTGDNLDIMRGMNSESGDLIYLDPPFNSNADYAALIGSQAAGAEFKDTLGLNDIDLAWHGLIRTDYPALYALLTAVRSVHGDSMPRVNMGTILYNSRCLRWLHETELGRPDQAFSGRFLKVTTHPEKLQKISCMISRCAGFMLKKLCFLVCSLHIFQQLPELRDVAFLIFIVGFP